MSLSISSTTLLRLSVGSPGEEWGEGGGAMNVFNNSISKLFIVSINQPPSPPSPPQPRISSWNTTLRPLPQVSADSVDRSCWRATVRFSVSLRVGSSGLLGDLAGDSGLHPADEREEVKVRLATKTLGPRGGGARAGSRH